MQSELSNSEICNEKARELKYIVSKVEKVFIQKLY